MNAVFMLNEVEEQRENIFRILKRMKNLYYPHSYTFTNGGRIVVRQNWTERWLLLTCGVASQWWPFGRIEIKIFKLKIIYGRREGRTNNYISMEIFQLSDDCFYKRLPEVLYWRRNVNGSHCLIFTWNTTVWGYR